MPIFAIKRAKVWLLKKSTSTSTTVKTIANTYRNFDMLLAMITPLLRGLMLVIEFSQNAKRDGYRLTDK